MSENIDMFSGFASDYANDFAERCKEERTNCYDLIQTGSEKISADGGKLQQYLNVQAVFRDYSPSNVILISEQRPQAKRLGDREYWRNKGVYIQKSEWNHPVHILVPGKEYEREDGSIGQYYNVKKVYDISQLSTRSRDFQKQTEVQPVRLVRAAVSTSHQVKIHPVNPDELKMGALYVPQDEKIYIRNNMTPEDTFQSISIELAHVEFAKQGYDRPDVELQAYCSGYLLCKQYGVDTGKFNFSQAPQLLNGVEPQDLRNMLSKIRDTANDLSFRLQRVLDRQTEQSRESGR